VVSEVPEKEFHPRRRSKVRTPGLASVTEEDVAAVRKMLEADRRVRVLLGALDYDCFQFLQESWRSWFDDWFRRIQRCIIERG
jgi:hypothetical protein